MTSVLTNTKLGNEFIIDMFIPYKIIFYTERSDSHKLHLTFKRNDSISPYAQLCTNIL
jgi:hypothetical protein